MWEAINRRNSILRVGVKFLRALRRPGRLIDYIRYRDFYCGDDWNYWWMGAFDRYRALPERFARAIEVGCGPYTNVRLISRRSRIEEIHCADPLIDTYRHFKSAWLAENLAAGRVRAHAVKGEALGLPDSHFDLAVCINVLDHVQDAMACLTELTRVLQPGGYVVFGQDLTDDEDLAATHDDPGHPILISGATLERFFADRYRPVYSRILPRELGRTPSAHYGTLLFVGQKLAAVSGR